ncbi:hypothetical protein MMC08_003808 [Hypocenomyce scalaris]|nr:hypothetical protein [Hypocenomyce scalaris]
MSEIQNRESLPTEVDTAAQGVHNSGEHNKHMKSRKNGIAIRKSSTSDATIYSQSLPSEPFISRASGINPLEPSHTDHPGGGTSNFDEATRAHRTAALRRLNGTATKPTKPGSAASSQPVLVRSHSIDMPSPKAAVPGKSERVQDKSVEKSNYELPPLEAFSFQEILQSINSEITVPIDNIAEICGRSKMSLSNEYSSHLPPQAEFSQGISHGANHSLDAVLHPRLLTVDEASSSHERLWEDNEQEVDGMRLPMQERRHSRAKSASWALLGAQHGTQQEHVARTAAPITETSQMTQVSSSLEGLAKAEQPPGSLTRPQSETPASSVHFSTFSSLVPSWLRNSHAWEGPAHPSSRDANATEALNKLLKK